MIIRLKGSVGSTAAAMKPRRLSLKFQRRFPNEGSPPEIVRTLPSLPLLCAAAGLMADRLNLAAAIRPRSVSTQTLQMIAGNVTLTRPQARHTLGRLTANFVSFLIDPPLQSMLQHSLAGLPRRHREGQAGGEIGLQSDHGAA